MITISIEGVAFLEQYPFLLPLLRETLDETTRFFPSFTGHLEVHTDPECPDDRQLILWIPTDRMNPPCIVGNNAHPIRKT
jgi:hypothetical protein